MICDDSKLSTELEEEDPSSRIREITIHQRAVGCYAAYSFIASCATWVVRDLAGHDAPSKLPMNHYDIRPCGSPRDCLPIVNLQQFARVCLVMFSVGGSPMLQRKN